MRVSGSIKDAATQRPIPGANVDLAFADMELAKLSCDKAGRFEYREEPQYIGEVLNCNVEKKGYEPREVYYKIEHEEIHIDIELVPERIELNLNLKDEKRNPLDGVKITLEVDGEQIGIGFSDKNGLVKITLSPDLEEKTIKFKAELGGFEVATDEIQLRKETSHEICIKKVPVPPPLKWPKIAAGIVAAVVAAITIYLLIPNSPPPEPQPPEIHYFEANPPTISRGQSSTLKWEISNAARVRIEPGIGNVGASGLKMVSPTETTEYTLIAENEAGERIERSRVEVGIPTPTIHRFSANPLSMTRGQRSTLSWETSNAEIVRIEPGIGDVSASDSRTVLPEETTTYTLIARNEEGKTVEGKVTVEVIVPPEFSVTEMFLEAIPPSYEGDCPTTVRFRGKIYANGRGTVRYTFIRSDGATRPEHTLNFEAAGSRNVSNTWQLGHNYSGWQAIRIFSPKKMESNQARFQVRCQIKEDCLGFNWRNVTVKKINGRWKVVEGNHWIMDFENKKAEARHALRIIKHYRLDQMCFIGRPKPSMTYFLSHGNAPSGSMPGEDCISFNINKIWLHPLNSFSITVNQIIPYIQMVNGSNT